MNNLKLKFFISPIILLLSLVGFSAHADIPPPNSYFVDRCTKITNLSDFPEIVLIGNIVFGETNNYLINENECLDGGYKFAKFSIYWNTKSKGTLVEDDKLLLSDLKVNGHWQPNKIGKLSPQGSQETIDYLITKNLDGEYSLELSLVEKPIGKLNFFKWFSCSLKSLFGKQCS